MLDGLYWGFREDDAIPYQGERREFGNIVLEHPGLNSQQFWHAQALQVSDRTGMRGILYFARDLERAVARLKLSWVAALDNGLVEEAAGLGRRQQPNNARASCRLTKHRYIVRIAPE